jgi:methyl-accepting chemotaxis protein
MFGNKTQTDNTAEKDLQLLMSAMDGIIAGHYDPVDTTEYGNPAYAEKLNEVIHAFKVANNNFVMRLNLAMESIGDNSYVKKTLDQVQSQTISIEEMEKASHNLEESISSISDSMSRIKEHSHHVLETANNSTANMNNSIHAVNESSGRLQMINQQVQDFQNKIDKIGEIVDIVKKVAGQSNLLALNASIEAARAGEAGKGFAVVADQVRQLSSNTSESAEDIVKYVGELRSDINTLAQSMNDTTENLAEGNRKVEQSLDDIRRMNAQIIEIRDSVDNVFDSIDTQTMLTKDFTVQIENISKSYQELSNDCMETGTHIYKVGRYIDTARSDMVRGFAEITQQDWLDVFAIDHFILMWRVYNNAVDFERLRKEQLNNPTSCKIGKWMAAQTDTRITGSAEFKKVDETHKAVHKCATLSWEARDRDDIQGALDYFQKTYDAYFVYEKAIRNLQKLMRSIGYTDKTDIIIYRK